MEVKTPTEVYVENIDKPELGRGEIIEITYETGEALIEVAWPNNMKRQYWANELEFVLEEKG